jgi:hypothetical protein
MGLLLFAVSPHPAQPPSQPTTDLLAAAKSGDLAKAKDAIARGGDVNGAGKGGLKPLHFAATKGNTDLAALLLDRGAKVDAPDDLGMTPLHAAAFEGRKGTAELLLHRGANPSAKDSSGYTALQYATTNGKEDVAALLRTALERPAPKPPPRIITNEDLSGSGRETGQGFNVGGGESKQGPKGGDSQTDLKNLPDSRPSYSDPCRKELLDLRLTLGRILGDSKNYESVDVEEIQRRIDVLSREVYGGPGRPGPSIDRYGRLGLSGEDVRNPELEKLRSLKEQGEQLSPEAQAQVDQIKAKIALIEPNCH